MGKSALSPSSPHAEEQGRGTALVGGARAAALGFGSGQEEGEKRVRAMGNPLPAPIWAGAQ